MIDETHRFSHMIMKNKIYRVKINSDDRYTLEIAENSFYTTVLIHTEDSFRLKVDNLFIQI